VADNTSIEWTDASWPVTAGCKEISPGCANCYAAKLTATRLKHTPKYRGLAVIGANGHPHFTGESRLAREHLGWPLQWREPRKIFVADMSDLFYDAVTDAEIIEVFDVMRQCERHTFQLLTKRAARMRDLCGRLRFDGSANDGNGRTWLSPDANNHDGGWPLIRMDWLWYGVSVENRATLHRIDELRAMPCKTRFLSFEPLLEDLGVIDLTGIHQVIVGGESGGNGSRPMHPVWVRSIRDQCIAAGVAFFFKQWGHYAPFVDPSRFTHCGAEDRAHTWLDANGDSGACWIVDDDGSWSNWTGDPPSGGADGTVADSVAIMSPVGKKRAGRILDGRTWDEFPAVRT
jgi:protein gp37